MNHATSRLWAWRADQTAPSRYNLMSVRKLLKVMVFVTFMKKERILNVPNFLTLVRVLLTFVLIYLFIFSFNVKTLFLVFIVAAVTDFIDGQIARRFNQVTKFGAKFDIIADRFLWLVMGVLTLIFFPMYGVFDGFHLLQFIFVLTREIICLPFVVINMIRGKKVLIGAKWSGKVTTFLQGFAIPLVILSAYSEMFRFSLVFVVLACISGIWAARDYILDAKVFE